MPVNVVLAYVVFGTSTTLALLRMVPITPLPKFQLRKHMLPYITFLFLYKIRIGLLGGIHWMT